MNTNDIHSIYEGLFAATSGEISFEELLSNTIQKFDGAGGVIFEMNRKTGQIVNWVGPGLEVGKDEYINHLNSINPRMRYSLRHAAGHVVYEGKFIDDRGIDKHEFYDAIQNTSGVRYFLGSRLCDDGDYSLFHSIEFTKEHGHPENDKIANFKRIAPLIANAWNLNSKLQIGTATQDMPQWTPEHLPWSIYALSTDGGLQSTNKRGRALLEGSTYLQLNDGKLEAIHEASRVNLQSSLQMTFNGQSSQCLLFTRRGTRPLLAQITLANPLHSKDKNQVAAVLYIWDPTQEPRQLDAVLKDVYKFTLAEIRLAQLLSTGVNLSDAAEQLQVSRNTAKNQLQSMFTKTGTRRQNEFLVQIMGILNL